MHWREGRYYDIPHTSDNIPPALQLYRVEIFRAELYFLFGPSLRQKIWKQRKTPPKLHVSGFQRYLKRFPGPNISRVISIQISLTFIGTLFTSLKKKQTKCVADAHLEVLAFFQEFFQGGGNIYCYANLYCYANFLLFPKGALFN